MALHEGNLMITVRGMLLRWRRLGFTDLFHASAVRRGTLGRLFLLIFGTPHLGTFANGFYLRRLLKQRAFNSVLDCGCGDGTFVFYVASKFHNAKVTGVDVGEQGLHSSEDTLAICERIQKELALPNTKFQRADLRELDIHAQHDFAYCFDVLEHIQENKQALAKIYEALLPNGLLLLRIPTRAQKRILNQNFTAEHQKWAMIEHVGQHYEMSTLLADLKDIGYEILSAEYTMGFWGRLSFELNEALQYYKLPEVVRVAFLPILKLLRFIDTQVTVRDGDGLLVLCERAA